jgi:hypothetical protein
MEEVAKRLTGALLKVASNKGARAPDGQTIEALCDGGRPYLASRHWFGRYALNVLELPPHVIALQLGHQDGGRLVRELYGHADARSRASDCARRSGPGVRFSVTPRESASRVCGQDLVEPKIRFGRTCR